MLETDCLDEGKAWFARQGWTPFPFQTQTWEAYWSGSDGLVNAPTGSGKTYALFIPLLLEFKARPAAQGLQAIWITPLRALAKEIWMAANRAAEGLGVSCTIALRTGDTSTAERGRQKEKPPHFMITTPESLHLLLSQKGYPAYFENLQAIVVDEWHELLGSKRGVQIELALSRLRRIQPSLRVWGISATIGNMDEAVQILQGVRSTPFELIRADHKKEIEVITLIPDEVESYPWAGHLGIKLLEKVVPLIFQHRSMLIFTNTRAQCEIWYQKLLEVAPELAGWMAMHHGSIDRELRDWVEDALHEGNLKAVVCTSSLDLGVDFRPVDAIVQIGSPKGIARFIQRAGRSGHRPDAVSKIYFVPTHSLELLEGAAIRTALRTGHLESRIPYVRSFDVLVQYLGTLAVSEGFIPDQIYQEVCKTYSFQSLTIEEWYWILDFLTTGGNALHAYDEYKKIQIDEDGLYRITDKRYAALHRLSIGTITSDNSMSIEFVNGKKLGSIEEWFITQLNTGDIFWFAGRSLELVRIREMTVQVRSSNKKAGKVPAWMGGRMSFSSELAVVLREKIDQIVHEIIEDIEQAAILPLIQVQQARSRVPSKDELLIEYFEDKEGHHLLMYPLEGRAVHEGMSTLIAYRISQLQPISFSIAMNDYGFELLSDVEIPIERALRQGLFSVERLESDIQAGMNAVEMAKRRFRDIAGIAGLVFKGFPGKKVRQRHLQSSSQLLFQVFSEYDKGNLLLQQAFEEVLTFQLEIYRLRNALLRIQNQTQCLLRTGKPTPFSFPILVDRLREKLTSEKLEDRIRKMKIGLDR